MVSCSRLTLRIPSLPLAPIFLTLRTFLHIPAPGVEDGLELRVVSRGAPPGGGGEVVLRVPMVKQLAAVKMEDEGEGAGGPWG